jgi:hypothetical protein
VHSPDNQKKSWHKWRSTNSNVAYLSFAVTWEFHWMKAKVLTKTVLPFVYTIFSLLALSLVYAPLTVVGLAGYNATFVKDIVIAEKAAIDISIT